MNSFAPSSNVLATLATSVLLLSCKSVAFQDQPIKKNHRIVSLSMSFALEPSNDRPIYDPLGLYPEASPERIGNKIQPLEILSNDVEEKPVIDPLSIYSDRSAIDSNPDMSLSLPFLSRPKQLTGDLAGDVGFDPLGLASSHDRLMFMREAEVKHSRIAMLAAVGWPLAEAIHTKLAFLLHMKPLLNFGERVPSILNGGLEKVSPVYWAATLAVAGGLELAYESEKAQRSGDEQKVPEITGDYGFDPLSFYNGKSEVEKSRLVLSEIKHGRFAMMAVTFFAMQEAFTSVGVMPQLLSLFHHQVTEIIAEGNYGDGVEMFLSRALV